MICTPFCSTEIIFSSKKELVDKLLSLKLANVVLIMSESAAFRWNMIPFIVDFEKNCKKLNGTFIWIKYVPSNPTQDDITYTLRQIGNKKIDIIIAIGGGSCIDLAKGISNFYNVNKNNEYNINEITENIKYKEYKNKKFVDIIAVPSTAGTGSEVTQWATIWDKNNLKKYSIDNHMLKPKMAIIVPELTLSMPEKITLSTGLDAACQAIEAYWSKQTTPLVQEIAHRAIELIVNNLRRAIENPHDINVREKLCKASVLAGLAFSQTRTTACHSISYPLTIFYGIPHGIAAAITLDAVGQINKGHFKNDSELYEIFNQFGGIKNWINIVADGVAVMRLSAFGITEKDIPLIVDNAFTVGRMDNNPVILSREDVKDIILNIL